MPFPWSLFRLVSIWCRLSVWLRKISSLFCLLCEGCTWWPSKLLTFLTHSFSMISCDSFGLPIITVSHLLSFGIPFCCKFTGAFSYVSFVLQRMCDPALNLQANTVPFGCTDPLDPPHKCYFYDLTLKAASTSIKVMILIIRGSSTSSEVSCTPLELDGIFWHNQQAFLFKHLDMAAHAKLQIQIHRVWKASSEGMICLSKESVRLIRIHFQSR